MEKARYLTIRKSYDLSIKPILIAGHYLRELILIAGIYYSWNLGGYFKIAAFPLVAVILFRNFSIMHDAVHKSVSRKYWLNDSLGMISGGICLLPFEQWRRSHLEHHTWAGNLDKDPVTAFITLFPKFPLPMRKTLNFFWMSWFPLLAMVQYLVFWTLAAKITIQNRMSPKLALSLASPMAVWGLACAYSPQGFFIQALLPGAILYFVAVEVVNFPHHLQLPQYYGETRFNFWDQYKISRSCIYPKWFATWVVLNFNYHTEHHLYPDVPWYHLAKLREPVQSALGTAYNCDPNFAWILENKPKRIDSVIHFDNSAHETPTRKAS